MSTRKPRIKSQAKDLVLKNPNLNHLEEKKVTSHVQKAKGDWIEHSLMLEGYDVPFKYRRKEKYRSLVGARVNLTYYPTEQEVAGIKFEVMKVVRIRQS